ncbi:MAG: peptidylprolyl isomerase [Oceanococcus sp.]
MSKMFPRAFRFRLIALLLPGVLFTQSASAVQVLDYIVAVVNDEVVLSSELNQALTQVKDQFAGRGNLPDEDILRRQVLERIVVTKAQVQRARQGGLRIADAELNAALEDIAARNGMSLNKFALALRREGIDYLQLRRQVQEELLVTQLRQAEVDSRISVSDEDVRLLLEQQGESDKVEYHLAHILISVPSDASPEMRKAAAEEAQLVVSKARSGEDFAQLAITHSDSPRALDGGDLGWRRGNALPTLFSDVVPELADGGVSDPINASGGLHIVQLVEKRGAESGALVRETLAKHILLKPNILRNEAQTKARIETLRQQITDGADFAELAREHSEDPGSANQGGELGWQGPETFVPEFQRALDLLEPGELSPAFKTPFGWHIATVLERREKDRTDELRRAQARQAIFRRKVSEEQDVWIRQLRDEAYVEYRDQPEAG